MWSVTGNPNLKTKHETDNRITRKHQYRHQRHVGMKRAQAYLSLSKKRDIGLGSRRRCEHSDAFGIVIGLTDWPKSKPKVPLSLSVFSLPHSLFLLVFMKVTYVTFNPPVSYFLQVFTPTLERVNTIVWAFWRSSAALRALEYWSKSTASCWRKLTRVLSNFDACLATQHSGRSSVDHVDQQTPIHAFRHLLSSFEVRLTSKLKHRLLNT